VVFVAPQFGGGALVPVGWYRNATLQSKWLKRPDEGAAYTYTVRVTIEIEAEIPTGASENTVRAVTENTRTLKFTSAGFEKGVGSLRLPCVVGDALNKRKRTCMADLGESVK
jgi:hypothetical protein